MKRITIQNIRRALRHKRKKEDPRVRPEDHVSTGSSILNLNLTGRTDCGFRKGHFYHLVGDSSSGKTYYSLTCLAEACLNPSFNDYDLVHIDAEYGNNFNAKKFWPVLEDRLVTESCDSVEEFWDMVIARLRSDKPCILILDSEDVLAAQADVKKYNKQAAARRKAREGGGAEDVAGSYGTSKARENSGKFPMVVGLLKKTGSILIIISQTRDKIGQTFMSFGPEKTYSGGHALKFYSTLQIWTSIKEAIKKRVMGKDRKVGIKTKVQIKKNRIVGGDRSCVVSFYYRTGIDDIGSCIDYLIDEGHWKAPSKVKVRAPEFSFDGSREDLAQQIEEEGKEGKLKAIVRNVWREIEKGCTIKRKNRYGVRS